MEEIKELTPEKLKEITKNGKVVLLFSATWCPDCRFLDPFLPQIEKDNSDAKFYKVDRDGSIDVAKELKRRKAKRVFCLSTFGLFTNGLKNFDKCYEDGIITKVITTDLTYQTPELLNRAWYESAGMSKYIAHLIDTLNHDSSISDLLDPTERISKRLEEYRLTKTIVEK